MSKLLTVQLQGFLMRPAGVAGEASVIIRNSRRIRVLISEAYPHQELFAGLVARLKPT